MSPKGPRRSETVNGVFVTGTDTGIGKTVVSSIAVASLRHSGRVGYWKPVQTGIEADDDTAEVCRLASCSTAEVAEQGVRLPRPLSPHLSARLAGTSITVRQLCEIAEDLAEDRFWVVEGAGGLLVPLNSREMIADLVAALELPALVTSRSALGTINHTLLTLSELRARSIPLAGVVMVGTPNPENRDAIERYGQIEVLAEVGMLDPLNAARVNDLALQLSERFGSLRQHIGSCHPH